MGFNILKQIDNSVTTMAEDSSTPFRALNHKYTFDQYVAGNSNYAHTAALAVAGNPGSVYNPLIICGKQGMGSTHLLNAIGHHINAQSPKKIVGYCSAERFVYSMGTYQRQNKLAQFRDLFRKLDVLLIDDIQFVTYNPEYHEAQKELFHIIHDLHDSHNQIVITSPDNHPKDMLGLDDSFRSFLVGGVIVETQSPDVETKSAILRMKADVAKIEVPDNVIHFLATYDSNNMRELEGLLHRLSAYSNLQNIPITMKMARKYMVDFLGDVTDCTDDVFWKGISEHG